MKDYFFFFYNESHAGPPRQLVHLRTGDDFTLPETSNRMVTLSTFESC